MFPTPEPPTLLKEPGTKFALIEPSVFVVRPTIFVPRVPATPLLEKDRPDGAQMIELDLSRIEETEDGLIYEDEKGKLWKLLFDEDDKRNKVR